jgi:nitrogen-specific signal transduction histidine kinase
MHVERDSYKPMLLIDSDERIRYVNSAFVQTVGYEGHILIGRPMKQFVKLDCPLSQLLLEHVGNNPHIEQFPSAILHCASGAMYRYPCFAFKVDFELQPHFLLFLNQTPNKELSLLQQFAGTFMKDVNLGVLLIDTEFRLVDISDMACTVLGITKENALNRSMEDIFAFVPPEHRLLQRNILEGAVIRNHAVSWTNDQERYELLLDSNVLRDQMDRIVGAYVIFKDVTNLRSLEQQVQRSDRLAMIGQIAAGTAHEIRNPLTSIKGFLQVFRKNFQDQGMDKESGYTDVMLMEIDRINELVNEFLLLSKPRQVTFKEVDIAGVLQDILPIINNEALLHGVAVHYITAYPLPKILADRELLKQVFLNICKNGIEAMVDGGQLTITEKVVHEEKRVNIEIHDTGPGIPLFVIDKIFDPFFTTKPEGTGLGLSVCQRIIHDMGGSIRVSTKGFGTTFIVSIPYS